MFILVCVQLKVLSENSDRFPIQIVSVTAAYLSNPRLPPSMLIQYSILFQIHQVSDFLANPLRIYIFTRLVLFFAKLLLFFT